MKSLKMIIVTICFIYQVIFPQIKSEDIKEAILSNGLKVLILEVHAYPLVSVNMTYHAGSVDDISEGATGLAHLLEHMSLKGTSSISQKELLDYYQKHGGVITNKIATTGKFLTSYNLNMPSNMIEFMIMFEADRMKNLSFEGFEREKKVILSEGKINESNIFEKLHTDFIASSFTDDPFRNPVIGWTSDVKNITLQQVKSFYRKYYNPQNATLSIVGDVNYHETLELVGKYFGNIQNDDSADVYKLNKVDSFPGEIKKEIRSENGAAALEVGFRIPINKDLQPVFDVIGALLENRLERNKNIRKIVIDNSSSSVSKIFSVIVIPTENKHLDTLETMIKAELENMVLGKDEINNIITRMKTEYFRKLYVNEEIASALGKFSELFNDWEYFVDYPELIDKVTTDKISQISKKYFNPENRIISKLY